MQNTAYPILDKARENNSHSKQKTGSIHPNNPDLFPINAAFVPHFFTDIY